MSIMTVTDSTAPESKKKGIRGLQNRVEACKFCHLQVEYWGDVAGSECLLLEAVIAFRS